MNTTETRPESSAVASPESPETIRKVYVRDLREKDPVHTVFRVAKKNKIAGRSGKSFISTVFADKTGEVDGRIFDNVDQLEPTFATGDYVLVKGSVISFHNRLQILVDGLERLEPGPIDRAEFAFEAPAPAPQESAPAEKPQHPEPGRSLTHIREMVERVQDSNVRALLLSFLDDPEFAGLAVAPAAKGIHHAYKGGLADHILSVMKLAHRIADHYPQADRDLLLAGALLHDIGKVKELTYERGNFDYSDEGRLVGHLVITAQKIREKAAALPNFPPLLEQHITHIVLAHHGQLEYGSPKLPATLEALLVHLIDLMDSRVGSWLDIMAKDSNEKWTDVSRLYERHLWKGPAPTTRGKSPVEGRGRRQGESRRGKQRDHEQRAKGQEGQQRPAEQRPPRKEKREERKEAKPSGLPSELTFKPFNALAGATSEPAPENGNGRAEEPKSE